MEAATLVFLSIHCWQRTAGYDTCSITRSVSEFALSEHVIFSLRGKRLESCVATCDRDARCLSINYYTTLKRCDLNDKTAEWYPRDLKPTKGAVYITMVSRDYKQSPPCVAVCLPITVGILVRRCHCTENATGLNDCKCALLTWILKDRKGKEKQTIDPFSVPSCFSILNWATVLIH